MILTVSACMRVGHLVDHLENISDLHMWTIAAQEYVVTQLPHQYAQSHLIIVLLCLHCCPQKHLHQCDTNGERHPADIARK